LRIARNAVPGIGLVAKEQHRRFRLRQSRHDQIDCLVLPQIITGEAKKLPNQ